MLLIAELVAPEPTGMDNRCDPFFTCLRFWWDVGISRKGLGMARRLGNTSQKLKELKEQKERD